MSSSNCCFLTCIQISQEADQMVWYSHLFQNFPQFLVIHTVKGFGIVNKAEIDVFLELSCFGTTICMFSQLQTSVTKYMRFFFPSHQSRSSRKQLHVIQVNSTLTPTIWSLCTPHKLRAQSDKLAPTSNNTSSLDHSYF